MTTEIKKLLVSRSKEQLKEWGLNWKTIQKVDIKKKYKFPIGWRTLYKLVNNHETPEKTQIALLDFYKINYTYKPSCLVLLKESEDA